MTHADCGRERPKAVGEVGYDPENNTLQVT